MSPSRAAELAQHRDAVERYLLRLVMNRDDAEDLAQDTMARALAALDSFRGDLSMFHRWLGVMEHYLASSDHLTLGRFTCADISCASALLYAEQARMPVAEHPRVADWLQRIRARESWTATA